MGKKETRSNKWTFIAYEESAPKNLKLALEALKVPFAVSPLHDKDVNMETGEFKSHIGMVCYILILLKATLRFRS